MKQAVAQPLASPSQPLIFQHLRWRLVSNTLAVVLRQASVRMISMVLCSVIVFAFVYGVSWSGFHWIWVWRRIPPFGDINGALFDFLFVALAVMLIFSNALILYSSLFASAEAAFLLSTPARDDQIFAYKYQGALGFSSWGFLLLGSPVLLAFGRVYPQVQWPFYTLLPLFFLGFVLLPGSIEALELSARGFLDSPAAQATNDCPDPGPGIPCGIVDLRYRPHRLSQDRGPGIRQSFAGAAEYQ